MSANKKKSLLGTEEYKPKEGSWVAELEDAQADQDEHLKSGVNGRGVCGVASRQRRGVALKVFLRLCRSYSALRQWEKLEEVSRKGLEVCSSYGAAPPRGGASAAAKLPAWTGRFRSYLERAVAHRRGTSSLLPTLDLPGRTELQHLIMSGEANPNAVRRPLEAFPNSNMLHYSVLVGDVCLLETMVALGAAIDHPFLESFESVDNIVAFPVVAPTDATALVMVCATLAVAAELVRRCGDDEDPPSPEAQEQADQMAECAMRLVHLGADPTRKLDWSNAPDTDTSWGYRAFGLDGKSALEMAKLAGHRCRELVELMERHLRCSPEERAQMVHCRCGSRLPWEQCHSTGIGRPPPYVVVNDNASPGGAVVHYRVSPLARCPCHNTPLTYYECCWKDTACPAYLHDSTGQHVRVVPLDVGTVPSVGGTKCCRTVTIHWHKAGVREDHMSLLRTSRTKVRSLYAADGPQSHMAAWDPNVYVGCLERLDKAFVWRDLHWRIDKSELLRRTREWNDALGAYCDDAGLVGNERERGIAQHTAHPCAPCGRVGCHAFESEPKEFRRCCRCNSIAYCSRTCQTMDWHQHGGQCCSTYSNLCSEQLEFVITTVGLADPVAAAFLSGRRIRDANP